MIGIYCIQNLVNGKVYIGQSREIEKRKELHILSLRGGYHYNRHLSLSWKKYGENSFIFSVLEECSADDLSQKEVEYIRIYKSTERRFGYNLDSGGRGGKCVSSETKKILSEKMKGRFGAKRTEEHKRNMSQCRCKIVWRGFISPSGDRYENIVNLGEFCREHGLRYASMRNLSIGAEGRKSHKGWRAI